MHWLKPLKTHVITSRAAHREGDILPGRPVRRTARNNEELINAALRLLTLVACTDYHLSIMTHILDETSASPVITPRAFDFQLWAGEWRI